MSKTSARHWLHIDATVFTWSWARDINKGLNSKVLSTEIERETNKMCAHPGPYKHAQNSHTRKYVSIDVNNDSAQESETVDYENSQPCRKDVFE